MGIKYDVSNDAGMTSFREDTAKLKLSGGRPIATFIADSKTERQRGYQWGWLYKQATLALSEAGIAIDMADGSRYPYDSEILHELLKKNIAKPLLLEAGKIREMKTKAGREIPQRISTEEMSKPMFSDYVKGCKAFFWEYWGFVIPEPEDAYYRAIEEEMRAQQ
jgi:hypothetical protein